MTDYLWRAFYQDGGELWQRGPKENEAHTYADIDRQRLEAFGLFRDNTPVILVDLRDDTNGDKGIEPKRLIWRLRTAQSSNGNKTQVHLIGWQRKIAGRNVQSICFVSKNGGIVLAGQWQEQLPLRGGISPLAFEKDLI